MVLAIDAHAGGRIADGVDICAAALEAGRDGALLGVGRLPPFGEGRETTSGEGAVVACLRPSHVHGGLVVLALVAIGRGPGPARTLCPPARELEAAAGFL